MYLEHSYLAVNTHQNLSLLPKGIFDAQHRLGRILSITSSHVVVIARNMRLSSYPTAKHTMQGRSYGEDWMNCSNSVAIQCSIYPIRCPCSHVYAISTT
jgi:hypothetical protein